MLETNCPECGKTGGLQYKAMAEVGFVVERGRLRPLLNIKNIAFSETIGGYILCHECGANSDECKSLEAIRDEYDTHWVSAEDAIYQDTVVV